MSTGPSGPATASPRDASFASDNVAGVSEEIMAALMEHNSGAALPTGRIRPPPGCRRSPGITSGTGLRSTPSSTEQVPTWWPSRLCCPAGAR